MKNEDDPAPAGGVDVRPDRPGWWVLQSGDTSEIWCIEVRGQPGSLWHPIPAFSDDGGFVELWGDLDSLTDEPGNRWLGSVTPEMFPRLRSDGWLPSRAVPS